MWWGHGEAIHVTASSWDHPDEPNPGNVERLLEGKVDGVRFANVEVHSASGTSETCALCLKLGEINVR